MGSETMKIIPKLDPIEFIQNEDTKEVLTTGGLDPAKYFVIKHNEEIDVDSKEYTELIVPMLSLLRSFGKRIESLELALSNK